MLAQGQKALSDQAGDCPICGTRLDPRPVDTQGVSKLYPCPACAVQVWRPTENPGSVWYDESSHYLSKTIVDWLGWHHSYGLRSIPPGAKTLLDVGTADGRFVYAAAARGIDATGIDFSARLVRDGNLRYGGDRLRCETLEEHRRLLATAYDVVTLFDTVEHVEDPLGLLRGVVEVTRSGGTVIVSTLNRDGRPRPPRELDAPPHHLTRWNADALRELGRRAGLERLEVAVCPPAVAIKALLLTKFRLNLVVRLMRRRAAEAQAPGSLSPSGNGDLHALIRAKDLVAEGIANVVSPFMRGRYPGYSMVLIGRRP